MWAAKMAVREASVTGITNVFINARVKKAVLVLVKKSVR